MNDNEEKKSLGDKLAWVFFGLLCIFLFSFAVFLIYNKYKTTEEQKIAEKINNARKLCPNKKNCFVCLESTGRYCEVFYSLND